MPPGLSEVPVRVKKVSGAMVHFDLLGGFLGVEPTDDGGLRPVLGWAVRSSHGDAVVCRRFREAAEAPPVSTEERDRQVERLKAEAEAAERAWAEHSPHVDFDGWCVIEGCLPAFATPLLSVGDGFSLPATAGGIAVLVHPVRDWRCRISEPVPVEESMREFCAQAGHTHSAGLMIEFGELGDGTVLLGYPHALIGIVEMGRPDGTIERLGGALLPGLLKMSGGPPSATTGELLRSTAGGLSRWMRDRGGDLDG